MRLGIILFIVKILGHLAYLTLKLAGVFLVEQWRRGKAVRAFRQTLIQRGVPKERAQALAKRYASMMSFRELIRIARSMSG